MMRIKTRGSSILSLNMGELKMPHGEFIQLLNVENDPLGEFFEQPPPLLFKRLQKRLEEKVYKNILACIMVSKVDNIE